MVHDITFHDDDTMRKVYRALISVGLSDRNITDAITRMQNDGILFREIMPVFSEKRALAEEREKMTEPMPDRPPGLPLRVDYENYQHKARRIVLNWLNTRDDAPSNIAFEDIYVVWFCKTLQNWKALVSTTIEDNRYYEVTYNGDEHVTYLDVYKKEKNYPIPD